MNEIIRRDILSIIKDALSIIEQNELFRLKELSDHVIHNASIFQDSDTISIAVIIYTIAKLDDVDRNMLVSFLKLAAGALENNEDKNYRREIKKLFSKIQKSKARFYIEEVFERAQIKKASRMYEHGISLPQVADALGVSRWELMDYIGKTTITDTFEDMSDVKSKIKFTRSLFS